MESESSNRKQRIDPRLKAAGWSIGSFDPTYAASPPKNTAVEEWPTTAGPADYALCETGLVLGVVEAKKLTIGAQGVLPQAERYSRAIKIDIAFPGGFGVPFLYSTNGEEIWFHDVRQPAEPLAARLGVSHPDGAARADADRDFDARAGDAARDPTARGHSAVPGRGQHRRSSRPSPTGNGRCCVTMATGTGKTLMTVNEIYRLMKSGVARRVLFLVDRRALAAQAVRAFASLRGGARPEVRQDLPGLLAALPAGRLRQRTRSSTPTSCRTRCSPTRSSATPSSTSRTIQRMSINLFGGEAALTIGDEAIDDDAEQARHPDPRLRPDRRRRVPPRLLGQGTVGLAQHARLLRRDQDRPDRHARRAHDGLLREPGRTATTTSGRSARATSSTTTSCEISSDVRMNGVFLQRRRTGRPGRPRDREPRSSTCSRTSARSTRRRSSGRSPRPTPTARSSKRSSATPRSTRREYGRFPKTLIFAANDLPHTSHADQLVDQARDIFGRGEAFVAKITGRVDRPLQQHPRVPQPAEPRHRGHRRPAHHWRRHPGPGVSSSSCGRSSRASCSSRCSAAAPARASSTRTRDHFVVFDCFDGTLLEYFRTDHWHDRRAARGRRQDRRSRSSRTSGRTGTATTTSGALVKRLQRIDKQMSGDARDLFARFIPDGDMARFAEDLPRAGAQVVRPHHAYPA